MKLNKEKYLKIKEIILYLFGMSFFWNFDIAKILLQIMAVFILIDIFYFKEKLDCGNDKIRNFIIFLIIGGTLWNYFADFNYRAARAFFKINRYFFLVFYMYPLIKYKKEILRNFFITLFISYLTVIIRGINFYENVYKVNRYSRFNSFEGVMEVGILVAMGGAFFVGNLIQAKNWKEIAFNGILIIISFFLIVLTQTRASLLAFIGAIGAMLLFNRNLKLIIGSFIVGVLLLVGFLQTPQAQRFKTNTFNTKMTTNNFSNGLRVQMWKIAIWKFTQNPIMGTGTKQGKELFDIYVKENYNDGKVEKAYQNELLKKFDDAHNMYLNGLADNGLFFLVHLVLIFGIVPYSLLKNKNFKYQLQMIGSFVTFYIYGMLWPIWYHSWTPMLLWGMVSLVCCSYVFKDNEG